MSVDGVQRALPCGSAVWSRVGVPLGFSGQYDDNLQVPSLLGDHSLQLQPLRAPPRHLHDLLPQPAPDGFKNSFEQAERKPFPALGKE